MGEVVVAKKAEAIAMEEKSGSLAIGKNWG
jgi:hypothetical protein